MLFERASALLKRFYGYETFRPMQFDIIESVMSGHDALVLMPTGGGKSVCYQLPALMSEGVTIVVSPLIALMKDQVETLLSNGIPAAAINSNQTEAENRMVMEAVFHGHVKLLYMSPERLVSEVERWGDGIHVSMIAIDEAHCISQWGHDFRPEYTQLGRLKERFPDIPVMALTATADRTTRDDIVRQLSLSSPDVFISSFDRPNLSLKVMGSVKKNDRVRIIQIIARRHKGESGIVYCMTRKEAEQMAVDLGRVGLKAGCYHAGMSANDRNLVQTKFINSDIDIVCATIAFGMGIDKSNIRWVVHNNLPASIESYYQEIGRAGRDGMPAETILFYSLKDVILRERFLEESGQQALNTEKLRFMQQYAEASICRRRILLSYFNEEMDHDCGNCDVCLDPPTRFDGTIHAQKALSAIVRTDGRAGISMLIDILRGSCRADLIAKGYDRLRTYGVGRDCTAKQWEHYLTQMLQLGIYTINWGDNRRLEVTPYGRRVLFEGEKIELSELRSDMTNVSSVKKADQTLEIAETDLQTILFAAFKKRRLEIAKREGVPAYVVFTDKTLHEFSRTAPTTFSEFSSVHGVGERKARRYWREFVNISREKKGMSAIPGEAVMHQMIADDIRNKVAIEETGRKFGMSQRDVYHEVADMIERGQFKDYDLICDRNDFTRIMELNRNLSETRFKAAVRNEFPDGLEEVALAMAMVFLRERMKTEK